MAYNKTVWIDQDVENPRTYTQRKNDDGSVTLLDHFGTITELGTPVNAENMNKIEEGIAAAVEKTSIVQDLTTPAADTVPSTQAVANESSRITTIMDNYVKKTGDTMTGNLFLENQIDTESQLDFRNPNFDHTNLQKSMNIGRIRFLDKNNYQTGQIFLDYDNTIKLYRLGINCAGFIEVPDRKYPKAALNTNSFGDNWIRLGNGLQICWGLVGGNEQQITFPQPFGNTNYSITLTGQNSKNEAYASVVRENTKTVTGVRVYCAYLNKYYIAIGYWY